MTKLAKRAAVAAVAAAIGALSSPARADLLPFAQATADAAPSFQWTQDDDGVGGVLHNIGSVWRLKEVLPASVMDGLVPASGVDAAFSLSANTHEEYGCGPGGCGVGGLDGSFSYVYVGPGQSYSANGVAQTLSAGANLLTVSFENAFLSGDGSGALRIATADGATITAVYSDLFALPGATIFEATGYDLTFGFSGGSATVSPNGKSFDSFRANGNGAFMAITGVPEPATWALLILGFASAGAMLRGRRRAWPAA